MGLIRTLLALAVVFAHTPWMDGFVFTGGRNAVQLFYIISGFLITFVLTREGSYQSVKGFYLNRALRIYPVYLVVAVVALALSPWIRPEIAHTFRQAPVAAQWALGVANVTLIGQDWLMFTAVHAGQLHWASNFKDSEILIHEGLLVPQAWTLGVELSFYLLAPFVVKHSGRLLALLFLSIGMRVWLATQGLTQDPWTYRFFPNELALFLVGAATARWLLPAWLRIPGLRDQRAWLTLASGVVFLLCLSYAWIPLPNALRTLILFGLFVPLLPLTFLFQNQAPWDRKIGELSYPIYVGHMVAVWSLHQWPAYQAARPAVQSFGASERTDRPPCGRMA
jgi:peptidoglycan/LPS O-acetylase OafA/YrhL